MLCPGPGRFYICHFSGDSEGYCVQLAMQLSHQIEISQEIFSDPVRAAFHFLCNREEEMSRSMILICKQWQ